MVWDTLDRHALPSQGGDNLSSDQLTVVILLRVFRNPKANHLACMKNLVNDGIYYHINWLSGFFHINSLPLYTLPGN